MALDPAPRQLLQNTHGLVIWLTGAGVSAVRERMLRFYRTWLSVRDLAVPTVAAVNGAAIVAISSGW